MNVGYTIRHRCGIVEKTDEYLDRQSVPLHKNPFKKGKAFKAIFARLKAFMVLKKVHARPFIIVQGLFLQIRFHH